MLAHAAKLAGLARSRLITTVAKMRRVNIFDEPPLGLGEFEGRLQPAALPSLAMHLRIPDAGRTVLQPNRFEAWTTCMLVD